jgi:phosphatidylinositol glycan class C protein
MSSKVGWRRVLYEAQPYADNFVDKQKFLEHLELSSPVVTVPFFDMILAASTIAEEITAISLFLTIYKYIVLPESDYMTLFVVDIMALLLGNGIHWIFDNGFITDLSSAFRHLLVYGGYLRLIAPLLKSLTSSYSEDTIHACSLFFTAVHLLFQDYSFINSSTGKFSGTLSLNAAMFTAVLLASRLDSLQKVSSFMLLAVILFCLLPHTIRLVKKNAVWVHIIMTAGLWGAVTYLLFKLDRTLLFAYEITVVFFSVICPFWMQFIGSKYKKSLRGPWDIAQVPETDKED